MAKNLHGNAGDEEISSISGLGRSLEEEMSTHSRILAKKSHGQSLEGYSPQSCKESDTTEHIRTKHLKTYYVQDSKRVLGLGAFIQIYNKSKCKKGRKKKKE